MRNVLRPLALPMMLALAAGLAAPDAASAQGEQVFEPRLMTPVGLAHGTAQGAAVFLAGLVAFAALVWFPASRKLGLEAGLGAGRWFARGTLVLFGVLAVAGAVELSLFAVRASGESLDPGLFWEALSDTRTGRLWLVRLGLGSLAVVAAVWAYRRGSLAGWWASAFLGGAMLVTLAQQSHAATEGGVALLASWLHVVGAALWMGGLLGFPLVLLGPLRAMEPEEGGKLRVGAVRRFSRVATGAVIVIIATGIYAALAQIPSLAGLVGTAYGRALIMKLGLMVLLLATGGINLMDKGRGPFGRMVGAELALAVGIFIAAGFLTSLPPADSALEYGVP